jgi:flagellar biosynthesis protein FlhG
LVAIGGGKGGIGKSLVAATLGVELAGRGVRVVLADCDLGGANLHSLLGLDLPRVTLSDFVLRRVDDLAQLVVGTPIAGLGLISGARNAIGAANPLYQQKQRLLRALSHLAAQVVILDLGAGSHNHVIDFFLKADVGVIVVVPEPTAVENAYRFLKAAFLRRVAGLDTIFGLKELVREAAQARLGTPLTPAGLVAELQRRDPAVGDELARKLADFTPMLLVNQVREPQDLVLGEGIVAASRRLFGLELGYLGHLRHCDQVRRAVRARQPVLLDQLGKAFAGDVAAVTARLAARLEQKAGRAW